MKVLSYFSMFFVMGTATTDSTAQEMGDTTTTISPAPEHIILAEPEDVRKKITAYFHTPHLPPEL